ncbi:MAG: hypothetical protein ABH843_03825 [Candidatus Omnitrophota bacterium]
MRKILFVIVVTAFIISLLQSASFAGSSKTWATVGKGLAIYEGVKVLTGREGNIVDDVTGGMRPRKGSTDSSGGGSYEDGYNAGFKKGYDQGYNAGFRNGAEQSK